MNRTLVKIFSILLVIALGISPLCFYVVEKYEFNRLPDYEKVNHYLYGIGDFGNSPDGYVNNEAYYDADIISRYVASGATQEELAYMIYRRACLTFYTTEQKSWHLYANGKAYCDLGDTHAEGEIEASGYRYEKSNPTASNKYNQNTILQNVSMISKVSGNEDIMKLAKNFVEYGEQCLYEPDYEYRRLATPDSYNLHDTYSIAQAAFPASTQRFDAEKLKNKNIVENSYVYRKYDSDWGDEYGLDSPEKVEHIINFESIIDDSATVVEKEADGKKYYEVKFEIDTQKTLSGYDTTAPHYFEEFIYRHLNLSKSIMRITYQHLDVTIEVWDCGYIRSWQTSELWRITAMGVIDAYSEMTTREYYSFSPYDNRYDELRPTFTDGKWVDVL